MPNHRCTYVKTGRSMYKEHCDKCGRKRVWRYRTVADMGRTDVTGYFYPHINRVREVATPLVKSTNRS